MHKLFDTFTRIENPRIKELIDIFEPLLNLLALDEEFFTLKQKEFAEIIISPKKFQVHPFHNWFQNLLKNVIIMDSQAVFDAIRDLFLNRIAIQSPNCLECPDEHGCCHSTYKIDLIDYNRVIAHNLVHPSLFSRSRNKHKIKLIKDEKGINHCGAFDKSSRKCLIHQFKPPTCCKYPLISNIRDWSDELMAWTGSCAHNEKVWATRVHPAIMNACRNLWVDAQLLWESEQKLFHRLKEQINIEMKEILSFILAIKQVNWPYKTVIAKKILLETYSESAIQRAFQIIKKF